MFLVLRQLRPEIRPQIQTIRRYDEFLIRYNNLVEKKFI